MKPPYPPPLTTAASADLAASVRTLTRTAQAAADIRANLKAAGIPARAVSIRSDNYSMGSSIRIVVKSAAVSFKAVEAAARGHEKVSRDDNGEILSGSNRYVDVSLDSDVVTAELANVTPATETTAATYRGHTFLSCMDHWGQAAYVIRKPDGEIIQGRTHDNLTSAVRAVLVSL